MGNPGERLYQLFAEANRKGGVPVLDWEELPPGDQLAWEDAASAFIEAVCV